MKVKKREQVIDISNTFSFEIVAAARNMIFEVLNVGSGASELTYNHNGSGRVRLVVEYLDKDED